jgi:mRNA interferase RelE/StbE
VYQLSFERAAGKDVERLQGETWRRVIDALQALRGDPGPHGFVKLKGRAGYRIRVGEYRILYQIDDVEQAIVVLSVKRRRETYREQ